MAPLEDELRTALQGRAATLTPSPDPLAGVERRARGMRRRRVGASVAGTALAVLAVAGAVPLLAPDRSGTPDPGRVASAAPSPAASPFALDLDDPWAYRGDRSVLDDGLEEWRREWAVRHPGAELVPLFGQVWEPSGQPELVFASRLPGTDRVAVGVASTSESGAVFRTVERSEPVLSAPLVLPGDEVPRLLLVAAPEVDRMRYSTDGSDAVELAQLAPGVGTTPVVPVDPERDSYTLLGPDGQVVEQGPVADAPAQDANEAGVPAAPANVLDWPTRGTAVDPEVLAAAQDVLRAQRGPTDVGTVESKVLFSGDDDAGRRYLLGQLWMLGDRQAETVGVVLDAEGEVVEAQLQAPVAGRGVDVVALQLPPHAGQERGELVVVPRPGTGQVLYAGDDASEWVPKDTPGLDGVVLLERSPAAERGEAEDRLRLLDGDGREIVTVAVRDLLCGARGCS